MQSARPVKSALNPARRKLERFPCERLVRGECVTFDVKLGEVDDPTVIRALKPNPAAIYFTFIDACLDFFEFHLFILPRNILNLAPSVYREVERCNGKSEAKRMQHSKHFEFIGEMA